MAELLQNDFIREHSLTAAAALASIIVGGYYMTRSNKSNQGAPITDIPGPWRVPIIGNVNFPTSAWSATFNKWREEMGDTIYLRIPYMHILLISSLEDAEELMVRRANIYSGRPRNYFIDELMEFGWSLLSTCPGSAVTEERKVFRRFLGPQTIGDYDQLIQRGVEEFANKLDGFSGNLTQLVTQSIGAIVIEVAYGANIFQEHGQELVKVNTESMELMTWAFQQVWLPDLIPITRFLPSWIPGLQFPEYRKRGKYLFGHVRNFGFSLVQRDSEKGTADISVASQALNASEAPAEYLRDAVAMMYLGGVETTVSSILNFFAHMLLYPDVQAKLHKEIDEKIGRGGTLTYAEACSLEYFGAVRKESLRIDPPAPFGVVHSSTEDDVWKGYFIPKDTVIIPNVVFMLRDPRLWGDDSAIFKPERFLARHNPRVNELPDVESLTFGFGRRTCPGRYMAERNQIMFITRVLQAYEIRPEEGASLPLKIEFEDGLIGRPKNLKCRFIPR